MEGWDQKPTYLYKIDPNVATEILSWKFESYFWSFAAGTVMKEETTVMYHFLKNAGENERFSPAILEAGKTLERRHGITNS